MTSVFCLLVKCSVKITSSCIFRHSSCVPTSSETWGMYFVCTVLRLILPFCNSNLFKHGALRMRSRSNWNFEELVFKERGKPEYPKKKPLGARERTNNKLNPHMVLTPGFEPGPHWWEASALTTAPPLLPQ